MRVNRLHEFLQWFGLLGAALAWTGEHVVGIGISIAACNRIGTLAPHEIGPNFGFGGSVWELALLVAAAVVAVFAEVAAVYLLVVLRDHDNEPPGGRHVFFAYAAVPGNLVFLGLILADGIMSLYQFPCVQG